MHISCAKCSTRYVVKAESIGDKGRMVKCAKCGHKWFQKPATFEEKEIVKNIQSNVAAAINKEASEQPKKSNHDEIPPLSEEAQKVVKENSLPVKESSEVDPAPLWVKLTVVLLIIVLIPLGLFVYRDTIIERYPASFGMYQKMSLAHKPGLMIENVGIRFRDRYTLMLEAMVTNKSDYKLTFNGLQVTYYDKNDNEISSDYMTDSAWHSVESLDNVYIFEPLKNISVNTRRIVVDIDYGNQLELLLY